MKRKVLNFGKVDYNRSGRKNCKVTVEVEIKDGELSICGNVWNPRETDCYSCGQNLDELRELVRGSAKMKRIHAVWERWHLNHLRGGSPRQREHLKTLTFPGYPVSHYTWACEVLEAAGLHPDTEYIHDGKPYRYGSAWLKEELPAEIIAEVESW